MRLVTEKHRKRTLEQGVQRVFTGHGKGETGSMHSVPAGQPPVTKILRIRLLLESATYTFPEVSTATPIG